MVISRSGKDGVILSEEKRLLPFDNSAHIVIANEAGLEFFLNERDKYKDLLPD